MEDLRNEVTDFGWALKQMKKGLEVKRVQFRDTCYVRLQTPDENSLNTKPYLQMVKRVGDKIERFPVDLSCESLLADDWLINEQEL